MMSRIRIEIAGQSYTLNTREPEEYVRELAGELSAQVEILLEHNKSLSVNDALVLCAIGYLDVYKKERNNADHIRVQLKDYLEDAARARLEVDEARRKVERLTRELDQLEGRSDG